MRSREEGWTSSSWRLPVVLGRLKRDLTGLGACTDGKLHETHRRFRLEMTGRIEAFIEGQLGEEGCGEPG